MYMYTMALRMGGLIEDPGWHYEYIRSVHAGGLEEAKDEWARLTGFDKKSDWDPTCKSYWGWSVVCLGTSDPSVVIEEVK